MFLLTSHLSAALALTLGLAAGPQEGGDAKAIAEFQSRVKEYAALQRKLDATLPQHPDETTSEQLDQHRMALQRLLTRARAQAKRGDIFTEAVRPYFRRQLARALEGPDGPAVRNSLMDEDTRGVTIVVNGRYPETAPLSSVPPQILLLLPRLPDELQYVFVGEQLILLDSHANIVVDYIEKAITR